MTSGRDISCVSFVAAITKVKVKQGFYDLGLNGLNKLSWLLREGDQCFIHLFLTLR